MKSRGYGINGERVRRLMEEMGIQAIYPKKRTSLPDKQHRVYPYLLRDIKVDHPDEVWCADITYVPMHQGFMYLIAIMDWFSRFVISFEISNSLDVHFCMNCLNQALQRGRPEIFNTDQGSQFTSTGFTTALQEAGVRVSMDGRGRAVDNVFIERLWRSVKYEDIYLRDYATGRELRKGLEQYFRFYNHERVHQSLGYATPQKLYCANRREPGDLKSAVAARNGCRSEENGNPNPPYFC